MSATPMGPGVQLPRTHCFISLAHGPFIRTIRVRLGLFRAVIGVGACLACWLVGATLYLVFHDDLVATLMAREARLQYAYEDRIAALRGQLDHESSVSLVSQSTLEGRMRELTLRAKSLEMRASLVAQAGERAGLAHPPDQLPGQVQRVHPEASADSILEPDTAGPADPTPAAPAAPLPAPMAGKPRPEAANGHRSTGDLFAQDETPSLRLRMAGIAEVLERVDAAQYDTIAEIGAIARRRSEAIRVALTEAGLAPERLTAKNPASPMGGPFIPLDGSIVGSPFGRALDDVQASVSAAESLVGALPRLPFAKPLTGAMEVTSPFGARLDPFLGRPAMHTGVDLREEYGSAVRATAAGRVVSAGPAGGYGTMIEIDHGHGLSTRYAHLSAVDVHEGQAVATGEVIGEVGATGRATGPHLHYETRIDGEAVDPMRFLLAGERLAAVEPSL